LRVRASFARPGLAFLEKNSDTSTARPMRRALEGGFDMSPLLAAVLSVAFMVSFILVFGVVPGLRGKGH
jgi:hypothetical protein